MLNDIEAVDAEIVEDMDAAEAEKITVDIDRKLEIVARKWEEVMPLIRTAIERNAHIALGYLSPGAYLADRFGGNLARLPIAVRQDVVQELTAAELSSRAIAKILSVSQPQVLRDRAARDALGKDISTDQAGDTPRITSSPAFYEYEGDKIPAVMADSTDDQFEAALDHARAAGDESQERVEDELQAVVVDRPARVTGNDGKSHPLSRSHQAVPDRKSRRRPMPDAFGDLVREIEKRVKSLESLVADDRFKSNRKILLDLYLTRLSRLDSDMYGVIEAIEQPNKREVE